MEIPTNEVTPSDAGAGKYNFMTLGHDCTTASALKCMGLRKFALPFDWVVLSMAAIERCFQEDFKFFHENLRLNETKTRVIDEYGIAYPHDYPQRANTQSEHIGEGLFGEQVGETIVDNWEDYREMVKEKYNRRIERFRNIVKDPKPIILLCRYYPEDVLKIQTFFIKYYNKSNIFFINSYSEEFSFNMRNINPEKNGLWNEAAIWKEAVQELAEDCFQVASQFTH
jgi:hypothetical protein